YSLCTMNTCCVPLKPSLYSAMPKFCRKMKPFLFLFLIPSTLFAQQEQVDNSESEKKFEKTIGVEIPSKIAYRNTPQMISLPEYNGRVFTVFPNEDANKDFLNHKATWYTATIPVVRIKELRN